MCMKHEAQELYNLGYRELFINNKEITKVMGVSPESQQYMVFVEHSNGDFHQEIRNYTKKDNVVILKQNGESTTLSNGSLYFSPESIV